MEDLFGRVMAHAFADELEKIAAPKFDFIPIREAARKIESGRALRPSSSQSSDLPSFLQGGEAAFESRGKSSLRMLAEKLQRSAPPKGRLNQALQSKVVDPLKGLLDRPSSTYASSRLRAAARRVIRGADEG